MCTFLFSSWCLLSELRASAIGKGSRIFRRRTLRHGTVRRKKKNELNLTQPKLKKILTANCPTAKCLTAKNSHMIGKCWMADSGLPDDSQLYRAVSVGMLCLEWNLNWFKMLENSCMSNAQSSKRLSDGGDRNCSYFWKHIFIVLYYNNNAECRLLAFHILVSYCWLLLFVYFIFLYKLCEMVDLLYFSFNTFSSNGFWSKAFRPILT